MRMHGIIYLYLPPASPQRGYHAYAWGFNCIIFILFNICASGTQVTYISGA